MTSTFIPASPQLQPDGNPKEETRVTAADTIMIANNTITNDTTTATSALLAEYQYDDEETTDLLNAIRSWNFEPRSPLSPDAYNDHHDVGSASALTSVGTSTIGTGAGTGMGMGTATDIDTVTTMTSNGNSRGGWTTSSAAKQPPRTPLCNYSSKPSSLTAKILDSGNRHSSVVSAGAGGVGKSDHFIATPTIQRTPFHAFMEDVDDTYKQKLNVNEDEHDKDHNHQIIHKSSSLTSYTDMTDTFVCNENIGIRMNRNNGEPLTNEPVAQREHLKEINNKAPGLNEQGAVKQEQKKLSPLPQYVTTKEKAVKTESKQEKENAEAMRMLKETAAALGLGSTIAELQVVLPTVQKLVKVITEHVPRLEEFVEEICEVAIDKNRGSDGREPAATSASNGAPQKGQSNTTRQKKRRRNRKNMEARKERMDSAIKLVKENFQQMDELSRSNKKDDSSSEDEGEGTLADANALQLIAHPNGNGALHLQSNIADEENVLKYVEDYESYGSFTTAVKDILSNRYQGDTTSSNVNASKGSPLVKTPISSNKDNLSHLQHDFDIPAASSKCFLTDKEALQEIKRLIEFEGKYGEKLHSFVGNGSNEDVTQSTTSSENDTLTQDLLKADIVSLRRFVLHFAYLFAVRKDAILEKMNDLYVFSHEANDMINSVKRSMGLKPNCPIHFVARKAVSFIESHGSGEIDNV